MNEESKMKNPKILWNHERQKASSDLVVTPLHLKFTLY